MEDVILIRNLSEADMKHRLRVLEAENQRLMLNQGKIVGDSNRKVEMHLNEIRMLKEENKKLKLENKEMRDLCCFLDDDRQRAKRLSKEWQRFGRYTSGVMKQEVAAYQDKLKVLEERQEAVISENKELKNICLYLDEQRPHNPDTQVQSPGSSESSNRSSDSETHKPEAEQNLSKTHRLTPSNDKDMNPPLPSPISPQHQNDNDHLLSYIKTLEERVNHLENAPNFNSSLQSGEFELETETCQASQLKVLATSQTSTSSGTTYASSDSASPVTAVYVVDDDESYDERISNTLTPIDEETDDEIQQVMARNIESPHHPLRLSYSDPTDLSLVSNPFHPTKRIVRSQSVQLSKCQSVNQMKKRNLNRAMKVLRIQEKSETNGKCLLTQPERALIQHMCQVAWESLDRSNETQKDYSTALKITSV